MVLLSLSRQEVGLKRCKFAKKAYLGHNCTNLTAPLLSKFASSLLQAVKRSAYNNFSAQP